MTWQQGGDGIFVTGMIAIAIIVAYACACRWALRYLRTVNARQAVEVIRQACPWCPVAEEDGARDDATRDDCNCAGPCGELWCARKPHPDYPSGVAA